MLKMRVKSNYARVLPVRSKEDVMAVSLFMGLLGGAILGFATQNGRSRLCEFCPCAVPGSIQVDRVVVTYGSRDTAYTEFYRRGHH